MNALRIIALFAAAFIGLSTAYTTQDHSKIVACYWGTWAFYRGGNGKFDVSDIDPSLCTHGFYGFAKLNDKWKIDSFDPWYDLDPSDLNINANCTNSCHHNSYRKFTALKQKYPKFKAMLSIGGWNAGSKTYSEMASDPYKRRTFVKSLVPFVRTFGFDGIDLDWEYPGARDGNNTMDKDVFTKLIHEMGQELRLYGLLLTSALSPSPAIADNGYDLPAIIDDLDFVNVMCYDYHGYWALGEDEFHNFTGHNSPLYGRPEESNGMFPTPKDFNVYATISYYLDHGVPNNKIVMGVPTYGRGFMLSEWKEGNNGLFCPAKDGIQEGPYTRQTGIWGYIEILEFFSDSSSLPFAPDNKWTIIVDSCYQAPYAYNGPNWIGYDDVNSIKQKVRFINAKDLGGAMIWSLETDDFLGILSSEKYPLIRAINEMFAMGETYDPSNDPNCGSAPMCDTFLTSTLKPSSSTSSMSSTERPTTPQPDPFGCTEHDDKVPYPGDCHKYLRCVKKDDGTFETEIYNCGNFVFDPNIHSCVDPSLPGNENLCDD